MNWWLEDKHSGKGEPFKGSIVEACRQACAYCTTDSSVWCVWRDKVKVAECDLRGTRWLKTEYRPW